ncbi:MAG: MFS transporter, partial [Deltaproteobacteria bacterium]|nr:MFS transporter [Deltaproteobacteria bacterium]
MNRNIVLLSISQALMITCTSLMLTTSALVGLILAQNKTLATLPFALLFLCQMLSTIPASLYMG